MTGRKRTVPTIEEAVEKVIAVHRAGWKDGSRSEKDWRATLRDYAMPKLGGRPVDRINTADVMAVLLPIWNGKRVTARRVRHRISAVMRWAVAQGYREDNPAGEAIGAALPRNGMRPRHLAALPYAEVAASGGPGILSPPGPHLRHQKAIAAHSPRQCVVHSRTKDLRALYDAPAAPMAAPPVPPTTKNSSAVIPPEREGRSCRART